MMVHTLGSRSAMTEDARLFQAVLLFVVFIPVFDQRSTKSDDASFPYEQPIS